MPTKLIFILSGDILKAKRGEKFSHTVANVSALYIFSYGLQFLTKSILTFCKNESRLGSFAAFLDIKFMTGAKTSAPYSSIEEEQRVFPSAGPRLHILGNSPEPHPTSKVPYSFSKYLLRNSFHVNHC